MASTNIPGTSGSGINGLVNSSTASVDPPVVPDKPPSNTQPERSAATRIQENKIKKLAGEEGTIVFPGDLSPSDYFIIFNAFTYNNERPKEARRTFSFNKSIALPLPAVISDDYASNYNESNLYFAGNAAREGLSSYFVEQKGIISGLKNAGNADFAGQQAKKIIDSLTKENALNAAAASAMLGVDAIAGGGVGAAIKSSLQLSSNPYPVMIYQGSGLKPAFTFSWTLYPESYNESISLKKIVNYLRREMLPEAIAGTPSILITPAVFEIKMSPSNHTRKFKRCVITNLSVNYTPNGLSFLAGKKGDQPHPAAVLLSVTFKEIEVWLANDYHTTENLSFSPIEYDTVA